MKRLRMLFSMRAARVAAGATFLAYLLVYALTTGDLTFAAGGLADAPGFVIADEPMELLFQARVPFTYEPIAVAYLTPEIALFIAPMNLLLGGVLSVLLALNLAAVTFALRAPKACRRPSKSGLLAAVPGLLLGFVCCAPTILLALGSAAASVTLGFLAVRTYLYPVALVGLAVSAWLNVRRIGGGGNVHPTATVNETRRATRRSPPTGPSSHRGPPGSAARSTASCPRPSSGR
jgi:hypothetical protein